MKRLMCILLFLLLLCGCTAAPSTEQTTAPENTSTAPTETRAPEKVVGICLPERSEHWQIVAEGLQQALAQYYYGVQVAYAENNVDRQAEQIQQLVSEKADCLIVAPVDGSLLTEPVSVAKQAGIPVVAYEKLITDTDGVSAFVGFDYRKLGQDMGAYIDEKLGLNVAIDYGESYSIEFFMGSPEDNNALQLHLGLMDVLRQYLDNGTLVCRSGRFEFEDCCVIGWDVEAAKTRFDDVMKALYPQEMPDVICTATDVFATACVDKLIVMPDRPEGWPLVTGIGGEFEVQERIIEALQDWSALLDWESLAAPTAEIVHALLRGDQVPGNSPEGCNNRVVTVPAWFGTAEIFIP